MFGARESEAMEKAFRAELYRLIQAGVDRIAIKETSGMNVLQSDAPLIVYVDVKSPYAFVAIRPTAGFGS